MDFKTIEKYFNLNQVLYAEKKIAQSKAFGELLNLAINALYSAQPSGNENYEEEKLCRPFLYRGEKTDVDFKHDAIIRYNQGAKQDIPIVLINAERRIWHKISPYWEEAPKILQKDTEEIMKMLTLEERDFIS